MKNSCEVIKDLMPAYVSRTCSTESEELLKEHIDECISCKNTLENYSKNSDKRTRNPKNIKHIKYFIIMLFIVIIVVGVSVKISGILHVAGRVYSPDNATKQVVYVYKKDNNKGDYVIIKIYDNSGRYDTSISFFGNYGGIFWTSDSSKYVINVKDYISNIFVVDGNSGEITGIDDSLDLVLQAQINDNPDTFHFALDSKLNTDYEFIKWEKDINTMLIYYELNILDKNTPSGYFLYDYKNDKINDMFAFTK